MKIENQCCTLEQAKKLKELGVKQDAIWFWLYPAKEGIISTSNGLYYHLHAKEIFSDNEGNEFDSEMSAAYTVAELGVMLPTAYDTMRVDDGWRGYDDNNKDYPCNLIFKTEAECRAALLIALLENEDTTPQEVNQRLK